MATYYKIEKRKYNYDEIKETNLTEKERGLEKCHCDGSKWLLLPKEKNQKQYILCLNCNSFYHL